MGSRLLPTARFLLFLSAAALPCDEQSGACYVTQQQPHRPSTSGLVMMQRESTVKLDGAPVATEVTEEHIKKNQSQQILDQSAQFIDANTRSDSDADVERAGISYQAVFAEFIAMTLFVIIGCGSAMGVANQNDNDWMLQVSLTFGFAITTLAYAIGHYSGGHINCAVTFGLVIAGKCTIVQGLANLTGQMLGSVAGASVLVVMYPPEKDGTGGLGTNGISDGHTVAGAFVGELVMTFLLMFVVLETAVNPASAANRSLACVAIGFAVFLAHSVLIPIDGCSINPTRSFGPAFIAQQAGRGKDTMNQMWLFWAAPLSGAALAACIYSLTH